MDTKQFLYRLLTDQDLQQEITTLDFETLWRVAARYGYTITTDEINRVLAESPELSVQLYGLMNDNNLEFELDEALMALISGGAPIDTGIRSKTHA